MAKFLEIETGQKNQEASKNVQDVKTQEGEKYHSYKGAWMSSLGTKAKGTYGFGETALLQSNNLKGVGVEEVSDQ